MHVGFECVSSHAGCAGALCRVLSRIPSRSSSRSRKDRDLGIGFSLPLAEGPVGRRRETLPIEADLTLKTRTRVFRCEEPIRCRPNARAMRRDGPLPPAGDAARDRLVTPTALRLAPNRPAGNDYLLPGPKPRVGRFLLPSRPSDAPIIISKAKNSRLAFSQPTQPGKTPHLALNEVWRVFSAISS